MFRNRAAWINSRPGGRWRLLPSPFSPALIATYAPNIIKFKFRQHGTLSRYLILATGNNNSTLVAVSQDLITWETAVMLNFEGKDIAFAPSFGTNATIYILGVDPTAGYCYTLLSEPGLTPSFFPPTALFYSPTILETIPSFNAIVACGSAGWNYFAPTVSWTAVANATTYGPISKSLITPAGQMALVGHRWFSSDHQIITQGTSPSSPRSGWFSDINYGFDRTSVNLTSSTSGPGISPSAGGAVLARAQTRVVAGPPSPLDPLYVDVAYYTIYGSQLQPIISSFESSQTAIFPYSSKKISGFAVHPETNILYLAFDSGEIYTSDNFGASWQLSSIQLATDNLFVNNIYIESGAKGLTMVNAAGQIVTSP